MISFWNGNKSAARQQYEYQLFECLLAGTEANESIYNDITDYMTAESEGAVLDNGAEALVTVAGNGKFAGKPFIELKLPLCRGLLGWRLLVTARERVEDFRGLSLEQLKHKKVGVPATWVDAELFRSNGFNVLEQGTLDDMLGWLAEGAVDFITLGANEAHDILACNEQHGGSLVVEPSLALYYPFPLVFYVNQHQSDLARTLAQEWHNKSSQVSKLFQAHYGDVLKQAKLPNRQVLRLNNPMLPNGYEMLLDPDCAIFDC